MLSCVNMDRKNGVVMTDKRGELANSVEFRKMLRLNNYNLQPTAPESSFHIGKVDRLHQTLEGMFREMIFEANYSSKFWSDAMLHAVCIKNRLHH